MIALSRLPSEAIRVRQETAKKLEREGWKLLRVQGSHHVYGKAGSIARNIHPHSRQSIAEEGSAEAFTVRLQALRNKAISLALAGLN